MNIDEGLTFEPIVAALNRHRVNYIVIGGLAVILHGVDIARTLDIDITPASDKGNLKRLSAALKELDAKLRAPGSEEPSTVL